LREKGHAQTEAGNARRVIAGRILKPLGISRYRLTKEISVPAQRIEDIVAGRRTITADTDLRLCRFFGLSNRI